MLKIRFASAYNQSLALAIITSLLFIAQPSKKAAAKPLVPQSEAMVIDSDVRRIYDRLMAQIPPFPDRKDWAVQIVHVKDQDLDQNQKQLIRLLKQAEVEIESFSMERDATLENVEAVLGEMPEANTVDEFMLEYEKKTGDDIPAFVEGHIRKEFSRAGQTARARGFFNKLFELGEGFSFVRPFRKHNTKTGAPENPHRAKILEGIVNGAAAATFFSPIILARGNSPQGQRFIAGNAYMFTFVFLLVAFQSHVNAVRGQGMTVDWDDSKSQGKKVSISPNAELFAAITFPIEVINNHMLFFLIVPLMFFSIGDYANQWLNALLCTYAIVPLMMLAKAIEDAEIKYRDIKPGLSKAFAFLGAILFTVWWSIIFPNLSNAQEFLMFTVDNLYALFAGWGFVAWGTVGIAGNIFLRRHAIYRNVAKKAAQIKTKAKEAASCPDFIRLVHRLPPTFPSADVAAIMAE